MKSMKFRFFDIVLCAVILSVGVQMTVSCEDLQPEDDKNIYQGSDGVSDGDDGSGEGNNDGGGNPVDLPSSATANCYIVSSAGNYSFRAVKGNSSVSVGAVACAVVLWESFGTSSSPSVGDLISSVSYEDGYIRFRTAETFKEGNAVIAAKDVEGNVLWSWHIWMTDVPEGQEYYNDAGVMMDRNLGATSSVPGDVGALGLMYQWGRKDPFLGSASITGSKEAASTGTWSIVSGSSASMYDAEANPMTFYTDLSLPNESWKSQKTVYDPCPAGWRVPDGGDAGVWAKALGSPLSFTDVSLYDSTNKGMNFSGRFGSASTIWYPGSGYCASNSGGLGNVGNYGSCWSCSSYEFNNYACHMNFSIYDSVFPSRSDNRAYGYPVRCLQE